MRVRFWGVRGSIAVSGHRYVDAGGCTSCVEVEYQGARLVLDGGTGLRPLGASLGFAPIEVTVLFSHYHWDHIQGVPFFGPAYNPKSEVTFAGCRLNGSSVRQLLERQMQAPTFPVGLDVLAGAKRFLDIDIGEAVQFGPFAVRSIEQPHPNGSAAFRVEAGGKSLVYATDTEHGQKPIDPQLIALAHNTDLLIHDAQYLPEEYTGARGPARRGWGHSTWQEAVEAGVQAGAARVALFHHDPARDDAGLRAIEKEAIGMFPGAFVAREGESVEL